MSRTITAHFATLKLAVNEAHKYGVSQRYEAVSTKMTVNGIFTADITNDRRLTITRAPGGNWKMAVDVSGNIHPATHMPKLFVDLVRQPQFG